MSLAAPIALAFFGLFVPVILLYLLKQRRRRVEVSTLMFWEKILRDEQTVTSITRLKKLLSLLLQLLFITLLALAVARPLFSGKLTGARRVVLLLDNSASMLVTEGGQTRFDLARQKAFGVVRGLGQGDSLMLVAVAGEPDVLHPFTDSKKDLHEAIEKLQATHAETNFKPALKFIEQLPPDARETHVYLITDGAFEPLDFKPPARTRFAYVPVGQEGDNVGIASFQVRPLPFSARDFQIHIEVVNHTAKEQKAPLELRINGRLADAFEFAIPAGKSVTRTLRQFSDSGGEIEAVLDVKDSFALDNHAYATLPKPAPIKVRLVTPGDVFLERAMATDDEVELQVVAPDKYVEADTAAVTVFSGWRPVKTPPGNSVFVGAWPDDLGLVRRVELTKPLFTEWQRDHPINRHLALQNVSIEKAVGVEPNTKFQKLASSFGDPLVLLSESEGQKVLVVTFDTTTTDLPLRVAFPILLANAIRYLSEAQTGERWQNPAIGSILTPADLAKFVSAGDGTHSLRTVVGPDGGRIPVEAVGALVPVAKAGFYRGELKSGETVPLFAASLASPVESKIKPSKTLPLRSQEQLAEIKGGLRLGFEPWFLLALMGLILSVTEWALFHRRVIE
jgi:hypothetical protein